MLGSEKQVIVEAIREFLGHDGLPSVSGYDHAGEYPEPLIETTA